MIIGGKPRKVPAGAGRGGEINNFYTNHREGSSTAILI